MGSPCPTNVTAWTPDPTIVANSTLIKAAHWTQLRNSVNAERTRRGIAAYTFTDTLTPNVTLIKKTHIDQLRQAIEEAAAAPACTTDTVPVPSWPTDPTVVQNTTLIKKAHVDEMRAVVNNMEDECVCNCDYCACNCNYCACVCNYCTCACDCCQGHGHKW